MHLEVYSGAIARLRVAFRGGLGRDVEEDELLDGSAVSLSEHRSCRSITVGVMGSGEMAGCGNDAIHSSKPGASFRTSASSASSISLKKSAKDLPLDLGPFIFLPPCLLAVVSDDTSN